MSVETWAEEFMPIDTLPDGADDRFCLEHALKKWGGALLENCEKHGVRYFRHKIAVADGYSIEFDDRYYLSFVSKNI